MGKDGDRRASRKSSASVDDLRDEHARLVKREKDLDSHFQNVKAIFQKLEETYQFSKGTFSISRYGQLKDMIKGATSDDTIRNLQHIIQDTPSNSTGRGSLSGLLSKAKEFSGDAEEQNKQVEAVATGKSGGKMSSFMKKLKNVTGFSDEPIADEDVMSEAELQRDNARKQRAIHHHLNQFSKALTKLEKLKHDYEASKAHAPPKRYQDLKDMIKTTVAEKF